MELLISHNNYEHIQSHLSETHTLQMKYQVTLQHADVIITDERSRRLRLRILMLENEKDDLQEELALGDHRIDILEQECNSLRSQLLLAQEQIANQVKDLRSQMREMSSLQAELKSMNGITLESTRILSEKLALSRELATLRPEIDHARSQAQCHQNTLAEKLALERLVSTLEVELETERRASKRAAQKQNKVDRAADLELRLEAAVEELAREKCERGNVHAQAKSECQSRIDALEKELFEVKCDREMTRKESEMEFNSQLEDLRNDLLREKKNANNILKNSEVCQNALESKIDEMRSALVAAEEQFKECQAELKHARSSSVTLAPKPSRRKVTAKNLLKRGAQDTSIDIVIGTPDGGVLRGKRSSVNLRRAEQALVGEKSMFSITPYLNRTISMAPDTPGCEFNNRAEAENFQLVQYTSEEAEARPKDYVDSKQHAPVAVPMVRARKRVVTKGSTSNLTKSAKFSSEKLERVREEGAAENASLDNQEKVASIEKATQVAESDAVITSTLHTKSDENFESEPAKKKRKLLGCKTHFEDDDGEVPQRPAKVALGPPKILRKGSLAKLQSNINIEFGAFSPLKKDRRVAGASFLA